MIEAIAGIAEVEQIVAVSVEECKIPFNIIEDMKSLINEIGDGTYESEALPRLETIDEASKYTEQHFAARSTYFKEGHSYETDDRCQIYKKDGELISSLENIPNGRKYRAEAVEMPKEENESSYKERYVQPSVEGENRFWTEDRTESVYKPNLESEMEEGVYLNKTDKIKVSLTDAEKLKIKEETGWSDEIIDHIDSIEQYERVYKNAELHEEEINGRKCLVKTVDMDYVDPKTGKTNRELMSKGHPPIDAKTGERIELHHMGQGFDSPFAELTENSEHGDGNHRLLHPSSEESWRKDPFLKNQYQTQRNMHWKFRA